MNRLLTTLACFTAFALLAAGSAVAHDIHYASMVTIKYHQGSPPSYDGSRFHGAVRSDHLKCIGGRHVLVRKVAPGRDEDIGRTKSGSDGKWNVILDGAAEHGEYYAKAKRMALRHDHNHVHVC